MPEVAKPTPASFAPYGGEPDQAPGRRFADRAFPSVDRAHKGDRLTGAPEQSAAREPDQATTDSSAADGAPVDPVPSGVAALPQEVAPDERTPDFGASDDPSAQAARLYFGAQPLGDEVATIQPWAPGETPILDGTQLADLDYKRPESLEPTASGTPTEGQSIAAKGEVTGEGKRPRTPAERLGLFDEKARAKSEKCLAEAVYFEARGEAVRGQIAVAQVVMNRVFSGYYPTRCAAWSIRTRTGTWRCQFTFACDNVADVVREPDMWDRAKKIAQGDARRQALAAGSRQVDALPRLLGAPNLGPRDEEDVQDRRAHLLSPARLGRRQRRAELGHAGADRGDSAELRRSRQELRRRCPNDDPAAMSIVHSSMSSATSKFGAECVIAPEEA